MMIQLLHTAAATTGEPQGGREEERRLRRTSCPFGFAWVERFVFRVSRRVGFILDGGGLFATYRGESLEFE